MTIRSGCSGRPSPTSTNGAARNGVYLNIPDWYFLTGGTKTGMGYREVNWSLPRAYQEIIERQNIFDGTWEKTPSMGWMFVPLTEYQGGGAAATIEPLKDHLPHYEQRLANLFGAGVHGLLSRPAPLRHRRDQGRGETLGGFLQAAPRDPELATSSTCAAPTAATSITSCTSTRR